MSRASKIFFGSSLALTAGIIYGVHWMQQRESENMYLGVIRDEARVREKAEAALKKVAQPAAVVDEDCATCVVSPPPQLLEAQSAEQRARERQARLDEYEAQKGLQRRLQAQESAPSVGPPAQATPQRLV